MSCRRNWFAGLALASCLALGCRSIPQADPESLASVIVTAPEPLAVAHKVSEVFQEAGFMPVPLAANPDLRLEFDKPGTAGDTLLYGDWASNKVWYRAKVRLSSLGGGSYLVSCDAYRVLDHGEHTFEAERKLSHRKRGAYQQLLERVKARLK